MHSTPAERASIPEFIALKKLHTFRNARFEIKSGASNGEIRGHIVLWVAPRRADADEIMREYLL